MVGDQASALSRHPQHGRAAADQASASVHSKGGQLVKSRFPKIAYVALKSSFPRALSVGAFLVNERTVVPHEHVVVLFLFTFHTRKEKQAHIPS